jgi:hypothetical protein
VIVLVIVSVVYFPNDRSKFGKDHGGRSPDEVIVNPEPWDFKLGSTALHRPDSDCLIVDQIFQRQKNQFSNFVGIRREFDLSCAYCDHGKHHVATGIDKNGMQLCYGQDVV